MFNAVQMFKFGRIFFYVFWKKSLMLAKAMKNNG